MTQIDSRFILLDSGSISYPKAELTQDYAKDIKILSFYVLERLPKSAKVNLSNFEIVEYSEDRILIVSNDEKEMLDRHTMIMIDNVTIVDDVLELTFRTYLIRQ